MLSSVVAPSSSPSGAWLVGQRIERWMARVAMCSRRWPRLVTAVRVALGALGSLALMPPLLLFDALVSPTFVLLLWVVLAARSLGLLAALAAAGVGAWGSVAIFWPLASQKPMGWAWVVSAFYFTLAAGVACIVAASIKALRDQRVLQQKERSFAKRQVALASALRQALQSRDAFLGVAGHELRSPVTGAMLHAERWARRCRHGSASLSELGPAWQRQARQLVRLARLMEGLLDASHLSKGSLHLHPERLDVCALVRDVVDRVSEAACRADCPIALHLPHEGLLGRFDRLRLEQVIENLLGNALKYGAGKPIDMSVQRHDGEMQLTVKDRGIGISHADQARIFDCYERVASSVAHDRQPAGLGLGLWLVKHVVSAAGGHVEVHSAPQCGATFVVRLPC